MMIAVGVSAYIGAIEDAYLGALSGIAGVLLLGLAAFVWNLVLAPSRVYLDEHRRAEHFRELAVEGEGREAIARKLAAFHVEGEHIAVDIRELRRSRKAMIRNSSPSEELPR